MKRTKIDSINTYLMAMALVMLFVSGAFSINRCGFDRTKTTQCRHKKVITKNKYNSFIFFHPDFCHLQTIHEMCDYFIVEMKRR